METTCAICLSKMRHSTCHVNRPSCSGHLLHCHCLRRWARYSEGQKWSFNEGASRRLTEYLTRVRSVTTYVCPVCRGESKEVAVVTPSSSQDQTVQGNDNENQHVLHLNAPQSSNTRITNVVPKTRESDADDSDSEIDISAEEIRLEFDEAIRSSIPPPPSLLVFNLETGETDLDATLAALQAAQEQEEERPRQRRRTRRRAALAGLARRRTSSPARGAMMRSFRRLQRQMDEYNQRAEYLTRMADQAVELFRIHRLADEHLRSNPS